MIISNLITLISIVGILYLGSSLIVPFSALLIPICSTIVGIRLKKEIDKIDLNLSKIINKSNILLQEINKEQKSPTNSTTKSQTHSHSYQNSKSSSSTLDIPLEDSDDLENTPYSYQNGKSSDVLDIPLVYEEPKKNHKK